MGGLKHQKAKRSTEHLLDWTSRSRTRASALWMNGRDRREVKVTSEPDVLLAVLNVHRTTVDQVSFPQPVNRL